MSPATDHLRIRHGVDDWELIEFHFNYNPGGCDTADITYEHPELGIATRLMLFGVEKVLRKKRRRHGKS